LAKQKILFIEDEPGLRTTLADRLSSEGYTVEVAADGEGGFRLAAGGGFDAIILDLMLPGRNGLDICRDLRQQGHTTPILMLTARDQTLDKVLGLKLGADDYLAKPFEMMELLARLEALLRRAARRPAGDLGIHRLGEVQIDLRRAEVTRRGKRIPLAAKEYQLFRYFVEHRGEVLDRETILRDVWGYSGDTSTRTVDVHVAWLRQKLEENPRDPRLILTVYGLGYRLAD